MSGPSSKYGTDVRSAPLSRNVTSRVPLSIIDPSVGQFEKVMGDDAGAYDSVSSPAEANTDPNADASRLSEFTIRRVTTRILGSVGQSPERRTTEKESAPSLVLASIHVLTETV